MSRYGEVELFSECIRLARIFDDSISPHNYKDVYSFDEETQCALVKINNRKKFFGKPYDNARLINGRLYVDKFEFYSFFQNPNAIIVIPGIMGSRLKYGRRKVWEPTSAEVLSGYFEKHMVPYLAQSEKGYSRYYLKPVNDQKGAMDSYKEIVEELKKEFSAEYFVDFFAYDWRLPCEINRDILADYIRQNYGEVILVCHSMGGLIAESYIKQSYDNSCRVKYFISLGTPFLGAPKVISVFEEGKIFGEIIPDSVMKKYVKELVKNMPSCYELIPNMAYASQYGYIKCINDNKTKLVFGLSYEFLKTRPWAQGKDGKPKILMDNAISFHERLSQKEISVPTAYIAGSNVATIIKVVYKFEKDNYAFSNLIYSNCGDGTVPIYSASNNAKEYFEFNKVTHSGLVSKKEVLSHIKNIISNSSSKTVNKNRRLNARNFLLNEEGKFIVVNAQNIENISVISQNSGQIIEKYWDLYNNDDIIGQVFNYNISDKFCQNILLVYDLYELKLSGIKDNANICVSFEDRGYLVKKYSCADFTDTDCTVYINNYSISVIDGNGNKRQVFEEDKSAIERENFDDIREIVDNETIYHLSDKGGHLICLKTFGIENFVLKNNAGFAKLFSLEFPMQKVDVSGYDGIYIGSMPPDGMIVLIRNDDYSISIQNARDGAHISVEYLDIKGIELEPLEIVLNDSVYDDFYALVLNYKISVKNDVIIKKYQKNNPP